MHIQYSQMTIEQKNKRFCASVFEPGMLLSKSIVLSITGENDFAPASLILDNVKKENNSKRVVENLENDESVTVKKESYWREFFLGKNVYKKFRKRRL